MVCENGANASKRLLEVDLARGFSAIAMILCHIGLYLGDPADTGLYVFSDIIGSEWAAPIFMAIMGLNVTFSRRQTPKDLLKRGIRLFILGYALNFLRSILPLIILGNIDGWTTWEAFFVVDILPFAGLSLMLLALFKKLKLSNAVILAISLVMVVINQFLMLPESVPWNSKVLTGLVNLFCPVTGWSCFPLLTWFFFPAFGLFLGEMLKRCQDKKKMYDIMLPVSIVGVLYVYYQFHSLYPNYISYYFGNSFYYMGLKNVILTTFFICFALSFWYFAEKILPDFIKIFLSFLSKNLNAFYIFSWIIISIMIHLQAIFGWTFNAAAAMGIAVLVIASCAVLALLWKHMRSHLRIGCKNI